MEDGAVLQARVPSRRLKVVGGFTLEAGETTILTLDFDADKSVVIAGPRNVLLKPVVKLLVRDKDEARDAGRTTEPELPSPNPRRRPPRRSRPRTHRSPRPRQRRRQRPHLFRS